MFFVHSVPSRPRVLAGLQTPPLCAPFPRLTSSVLSQQHVSNACSVRSRRTCDIFLHNVISRLSFCASLKPNSITLAGSKPVRSWFGAGSELVRSWFEPDSVMESSFYCILIMATVWNRAGHYSFVLWCLLLSFVFFSSPILSRHRLDGYHTSTHGMALVRI